MDAKLNQSDLSALLAKLCGISATKADTFTKAFFDVIIEGLESDSIVKINGLGTFKMVDVASRSSVNVNTGEKFEIKGHKKISFIPAETLKDKVNAPFAMFEPVEVDDEYVDEADSTSEETETTSDTAIQKEEPTGTESTVDTPAETVEESTVETVTDESDLQITVTETVENRTGSTVAVEDAPDNTPVEETVETAEKSVVEERVQPENNPTAKSEAITRTEAVQKTSKPNRAMYIIASLLAVTLAAVIFCWTTLGNNDTWQTAGTGTPQIEQKAVVPVDSIIGRPDTICISCKSYV